MAHVWIALLLSLVYPGIGHIYNGQRRKGIVLILLQLLATVLHSLFGVFIFLMIVVYLWAIVHAGKDAYYMYKNNIVRDNRGKKQLLEIGLAILLVLPLAYGVNKVLARDLDVTVPQKSEQEMAKVRKEVDKYLSQKYGEPFVIDEVKYVGKLDTYYILAHPQKNPNLKLTVDRKVSGEYIDDYPIQIWSKESTAELKPVIEEIYGGDTTFESSVGVTEWVVKKVKPRDIPTYQEFRKENSEGYFQDVNLYFVKDAVNEEEELDKIFQLISFFKENGISELSLDLRFYDVKVQKNGDQSVNFSNHGKYREHLRYMFRYDQDLDAIKTVADLEQYFRKLQ